VIDPPATRPSLLLRLRDEADQEAWRQFVDLYAPLIYGLGRRRGLQDADAADLTQEVFRLVAAAVKRLDYDPRHGTFRAWLYVVARNKLSDFVAARKPADCGSGDTAHQLFLQEQPERETEFWDREYERRVFAWAADQVRGEFKDATWLAFQLVAVEGKSGQEAASTLGMSLGAVYMAKSRVLARLKQQVQQLIVA
jgi:RNA polymerase sigma factor (sigma-70 family)